MPAPPHEQAGGAEKLRGVLRDFYDTVFADVMIGYLFKGADQERLVERELELTLAALGADVAYTGRPIAAVHRPLPIMGGHFMRRRVLLAEAMERHGLPPAVRDAILAHTDALRSQVTPDASGECDTDEAVRRAGRPRS
jgi:truncated hemoglobin YjbI